MIKIIQKNNSNDTQKIQVKIKQKSAEAKKDSGTKQHYQTERVHERRKRANTIFIGEQEIKNIQKKSERDAMRHHSGGLNSISPMKRTADKITEEEK